MATDGPGLMYGDDSLEFLWIAFIEISNGRIDLDNILQEYDKYAKKGCRDKSRELNLEEYRFMAELVKVLHQGRIKEELGVYDYGDDEGNEITYYDILNEAVVSRSTLELLFKKSKELYIYKNGPGFENYMDINYLKKYHELFLERYNSTQEKEQLDRIVESMKKLPCNSLEDAQKIRNKLKNVKNKYKMLGVCSKQIIYDIEDLLYHGMQKEHYLTWLNSIKDNVDTIKEILDNPKESYVLYTKAK